MAGKALLASASHCQAFHDKVYPLWLKLPRRLAECGSFALLNSTCREATESEWLRMEHEHGMDSFFLLSLVSRGKLRRKAIARVLFLVLVLVLVSGKGYAFDIACSQYGKYRACEIKEAVPPSPFETGTEIDRNFSSPSKKLLEQLKKSESQNGDAEKKQGASSKFEATIVGSASSDQKRAVDFCMDRVAENWISSVAVRVLVKFEDLGVANLLGSAQPSRNWIVRDYICPVALAEAVLERELNNGTTTELQYDVWMTLNRQARWYTGTDAQAPFGLYDLVTVCMHETYHGLFMSGGNIAVSQKADGSYGAFFFNSRYRGRFDAFMGNEDECQIDGYGSNETQLGAVLTGNKLWFADADKRIGRLHAPRPYTAGSSLYHLSEWEYGEGSDDNDLMTPAIGSNYGQHNGGEILLEMQRAILDVDRRTGAEECDVLRDPLEDDGLIDQGNGGGDGVGSGGQNESAGFVIQIGKKEINGWIIVGGGAGVVAIVGVVVGVVVHSFNAEKRRKKKARKERRRRRSAERINFEMGNGGGVV